MKDCPLVSIIIPCYNHEKFLDDCMKSLLSQNYGNIELLICDDCSTDKSFEKITTYKQQLQKKFCRVEIWLNETNLGVTKTLNRMLNVARGSYIKILASDDALTENAIKEFVHYFDRNKEVDIVVSNGLKVTEDQHFPEFVSSTTKIYETPPNFSKEGFFERVAFSNPISAPAAMVKKSIYEEYGLYDESVKVEDFEFWLRIIKEQNVVFGFLDNPLIYYRISANSMSSLVNNEGFVNRRRLMIYSELESLKKYKDFFSAKEYANIVLKRILDEKRVAVEKRLHIWDLELEQMWKAFDKKDMSIFDRLILELKFVKQNIKKMYRIRI